jgi:aspartyl-tRNA(Asn)/glutamyl-tRNA(Gln) amidotransferase subunit B
VGLTPKAAANWVQGEVLGWLTESKRELESLRTTPADLVDVVKMEERGELSHLAAKKVLRQMLDSGAGAAATAKSLDLVQIRDASSLGATVDEVLQQEAKIVGDYRGGKETALNALLGRVMRATKGKGDPNLIKELLIKKLGPAGPAK